LKTVEDMLITPGMTVGQLVEQMRRSGTLGAGRLARATDLVCEMFREPDYFVFLTMAGPLTPSGLRKLISGLVEREYVNAIVSNGANIVHDMISAIGFKHKVEIPPTNDLTLRRMGLGRIGDILVDQKAFEALEKTMHKILEDLSKRGRQPISTFELLHEVGMKLSDPNSVLRTAAINNTPIFCPGLLDSMIGLHMWTFSQLKGLALNPLRDLHILSDLMYESKKVGAIILGGGLPKHHILGASILRDGVDAAIQITLDRPEGGSLSGAPLEEAVSWKKARARSKLVTVIGDTTVIFPVMIAAAIERLEKP